MFARLETVPVAHAFKSSPGLAAMSVLIIMDPNVMVCKTIRSGSLVPAADMKAWMKRFSLSKLLPSFEAAVPF